MTKRSGIIAVAAVALVVVACVALTRPRPRQATPLLLAESGIDGPEVISDKRGRPIISNVRTVEKRVLYRGSGFPTSFNAAGGQKEYADETAFEFLRSRNIRHVVVLHNDAGAYYAEEGYLRFWSGKTGFEIAATWVPIDPATPYAKNDRGGLHAAGILIALMREDVGRGGAVYVHDIDGTEHVGVAVAGYELWRNRGWSDFDATWTLAERRFFSTTKTARKAEWLRALRNELRFVIEL